MPLVTLMTTVLVKPVLSRSSSSSYVSSIASCRVPYDTHAFAGQGDYSELQAPLLSEFKVPIELLQRVYFASSSKTPPSTGSAFVPQKSPGLAYMHDDFPQPTHTSDSAPLSSATNEDADMQLPQTPTRKAFRESDATLDSPVPSIIVTPGGAAKSKLVRQQEQIQTSVEPIPFPLLASPGITSASFSNGSVPNFKVQDWLTYTASNDFLPVRSLTASKRKRILVTGGAGFVGSHLVDRLMFLGHE